ncbi:MAG: right-handed parallel beta-helix repeat-containing protein [Actinomycetota bacterium]|nr:right-handed parallel beta-helix repeat-containing protein [Actinomycetota bacterium]
MSHGSENVARRGRPYAITALVVGALALPAVASAHLERPSYWPDPGADQASGVPTGGEVPEARSLASAVTGAGPGNVRVVCQDNSLAKVKRSISYVRDNGYRLRPSQPKERLSAREAQRLLAMNKAFAKMCSFGQIQPAIDASGNNDRVVIMPGRYTEPKSRKQPVNDPKCNPSMLQEDQSGAKTPSYEYQAKCSNDQNLLYVQGRAVGGEPLAEPDPDRHGIPEQELGRCVRCNLQIEGSGVRPEDVLIDAGKGYKNPARPGDQPGSAGTSPEDCLAAEDGPDNPCYAKHVVLRGDRTDGFVGRNFLLRGAKEHGFYTEESDGVLLDRVKFFWNADYGHLSFTSDHHVVKNCDGFGSGDAVVYPGAAPQTGEFRKESFYPRARRNTVIKECDLHGSAMGYSGSMGNSVRVTRNHIYANANGLTSDTISAPGHPGFPADGQKVDHNWFYSNNLDIYREDAPFVPLVPQAVGTGIMWPGMNNGRFTHNRVFDNWRHGTLLVAIPDEVAGEADGNVDKQIHCPEDALASTSCDNKYSKNNMGNVPKGFDAHPGLKKFGNQSGLLDPGDQDVLPNGVDFWWDEFPTNDGNCWFENKGAGGGPVTSNPPAPLLPSNCARSIGNAATYAPKAALLLECFAEFEFRGEADVVGEGPCYWYQMPPRPGTPEAAAEDRRQAEYMEQLAETPEAQRLEEYYGSAGG